MSAPGVPCVFLKHWIDNKDAIQKMIKARKIAGVHSESDVVVEEYWNGYYKAYSKGKYGAMLTYIGSWNENQTPGNGSGWGADGGNGYCVPEFLGNGWAIFVNTTNIDGALNSNEGRLAYEQKIQNGVNPTPEEPATSITFRAVVPSNWASANIYLWEKNGEGDLVGTWQTAPAMTSDGDHIYKYTFDNSVKNISNFGVVFQFINGSDTLQSIDLAASASTCWVLESTPTQAGKYNATVSETCTPSAIKVVEAGKISIYPNPVKDILNIDAENAISNITIFSVSGQNIMVSDKTSIDVSALNAGIYIVKIEFANSQVAFEKFLKK
jgi:hypothetical protein